MQPIPDFIPSFYDALVDYICMNINTMLKGCEHDPIHMENIILLVLGNAADVHDSIALVPGDVPSGPTCDHDKSKECGHSKHVAGGPNMTLVGVGSDVMKACRDDIQREQGDDGGRDEATDVHKLFEVKDNATNTGDAQTNGQTGQDAQEQWTMNLSTISDCRTDGEASQNEMECDWKVFHDRIESESL